MTRIIFPIIASMLFFCRISPADDLRTITDAAGRKVQLPAHIERVICSGPGALRLLTYLQAQNLAVAVDSMEKRHASFDARPYAMANPRFKDLPLFGELRGFDHPELILALERQPQVIFKTYAGTGYDPDDLHRKTHIPVVVLEYGDLDRHRDSFYQALHIMGQILGKEKRAEAVIAFFESAIADLKKRTADVAESERKTCFIGGVAFRGPNGFQSTEPGYPPFRFVNAKSPAAEAGPKGVLFQHSDVAREKIIQWDPQILFLDLSTLQMGNRAGGLFELKTDPAYKTLTAVQKGAVFGLLPYNAYAQNFGSIMANAYFIGKLLYPERFRDIDPETRADEIYGFLVDAPVFRRMDESFQGLAFKRVPLN